ncbi:hypothetical protein ACFFX0_13985 [Citricoccus parietis]|uniref:Uncharacterized protein n=1 Tax=Citricoccus parietis TaxID=592307 RepID=A0ABV5FZZ1_9MICC
MLNARTSSGRTVAPGYVRRRRAGFVTGCDDQSFSPGGFSTEASMPSSVSPHP